MTSPSQQVLDCYDLVKLIIEYIPPHPTSTIIEEGYFRAFVKNMEFDCVKIISNTRLYPTEPKGHYNVALEFEKYLIDEIEQKLIYKIFYRPRWLWDVKWITECKIKRLNYIQDGLELQKPTYFEIFKFKTYMKHLIYTRDCLIKTCPEIMMDYYKIYDVDDEDDDEDDDDDDDEYDDDEDN
jgi:hypothetical protein